MDESSTSSNEPNLAPSVAANDGLSSTDGKPTPPSDNPYSEFSSESSWDRLSLALNRLESAILAKQNNGAKLNADPSMTNEERDARLEQSRQETLEARRERDSLKKVVEATLDDIRSLLK